MNNNNIEPAQTKKIRKEVLKDAGIKALNKLITEVEQALKQGNKKKIENKYKELQQFTQNNSEYFQNACSQKKVEVQQLLEKAKNQFTQNNPPGKFPTGWVVGGGILLVLGLVAILMVKKSRKKK